MAAPVIHVNNVSGVAEVLVSRLTRLGCPAYLFQPMLGTYRASRLDRLGLLLRRPADSMRLAREVRARAAGFLHVHFGAFGVLAWPSRLPYVLHLHGSDIRGPRWYNVALTRASLPMARLVLFATPDLAPVVLRHRPDALFLPNPVDLNEFYPRGQETRYDVFVASKLDNGKGVEVAIEGLALLRRSGWRGRIAMLSFGGDARRLRELALSRLGDVEWLPPAARSEMATRYSRASVVVGQLSLGALGMTELEALACGRPVIARWSYRGWYPAEPPLISVSSPEGLARSVDELLSNRHQASELGMAAHDWCRQNHDSMRVARELLGLYREAELM
jgi:glycosyltransferase involved in cell wall biosynthesis